MKRLLIALYFLFSSTTAFAIDAVFTDGEGIDSSRADTTFTVSCEDATSSNKGIAKFNTSSFTVSSGDVVIKSDYTTLLDSITADSTLDTGQKAALHTQGTDTTLGTMTANIDLGEYKITLSDEPTADSDLATKYYVDQNAGAGTGDVVGPAGATDDHIATFDTATGKLIQDSGTLISDLLAVADSPVISDIAYDDTTWDSNTDGASKNAIRDKVNTMDTAIGLNTAKTTNQTHTGEVTGSVGLVLDPTCISGKVDTTVVDADYLLFWDATDSTLKKVDAAELLSAVGGSAIADVTLEYKPYRIALNEAYTGYIDCQLVISDRSDYDTPIVDVDTATSQTSWLAYSAYSQSNEAWSSSGMPSTDVRSIIYIGATLTRGTVYYYRWRTYKHGEVATATDWKGGMKCL